MLFYELLLFLKLFCIENIIFLIKIIYLFTKNKVAVKV